jgi:hypothetical protein
MGLWLWNDQMFLDGILDFKKGRELVDDERSVHPKSTRNDVNIAALADLVKNDHHITSRMIVDSLKIPKTLVLWILKDDLRKRKLCACFVPHSMTPEQREDRVTSCQDMIANTVKFSCLYDKRRE